MYLTSIHVAWVLLGLILLLLLLLLLLILLLLITIDLWLPPMGINHRNVLLLSNLHSSRFAQTTGKLVCVNGGNGRWLVFALYHRWSDTSALILLLHLCFTWGCRSFANCSWGRWGRLSFGLVLFDGFGGGGCVVSNDYGRTVDVSTTFLKVDFLDGLKNWGVFIILSVTVWKLWSYKVSSLLCGFVIICNSFCMNGWLPLLRWQNMIVEAEVEPDWRQINLTPMQQANISK